MFHYTKQEIVHPLTTGSLKGFQVAFFTINLKEKHNDNSI